MTVKFNSEFQWYGILLNWLRWLARVSVRSAVPATADVAAAWRQEQTAVRSALELGQT